MLVGPWKWSTGGVRTFMNNVDGSSLGQTHRIIRFNIARPPKKNVIDNYGYRAIWRGGAARIVAGALMTLWHLAIFPVALLVRRPDVVQIQSSDFQVFWEAALYARIARAMGFPVLVRLGGAFDHFCAVSSPRVRAMIRRVLQWPARLIVQSEYWRDAVAVLGRGSGVVVLANSIPDALLETRSIQERDPPICFFSAGSEAVRKGVAEILEAMQLLRADNVPVRLHIVAANAELRRQASEAGLGDSAVVDDFMPHDRILDAMRAAQIFLLPSTGEGFPNALVEAMALGLAPVVTPVGAIPEIVKGTGALIVPVKDAKALAAAVAKLVASLELRTAISTAVRERVRSRYVHSVTMPILEETWHQAARNTATFA